MLLAILAGCGFDDASKPLGGDTGDTGHPTGDAYGCIEDGQTAIADTSVPAEGMDFAPDTVVAAFAGAWGGRFDFADGEVAMAGFSVSPEGTWALVSRHYVDSGLGEGGLAEDCGPTYLWTTEAMLSDETGALDERIAVQISVPTADVALLTGTVALDSMVGTTRPEAWDPADWAENDLSVSANATPGQWIVQVLWWASTGVDAKDEGAETETGTVSPSGMSELVGTMTATPLE
ncbi:MAG: hypothetical protein Q8P41_10830 [Pseudomonadota bacterium]|nr:hypothetical protein [Pseudomonadota bacterium]